MKRLIIILAVVLAGSVGGLILNQRQLGRELVTVRKSNDELRQELAERPAISPQSLAQAEMRLEQAQLAAAAAEQRITQLANSLAAQERKAATPRPLTYAASSEAASLHTDHPGRVRPPASSHSAAGQLLNRNWGPEQVVGAANTDRAGDIVTAWASLDPDGGPEWLHVNYDRLVDISEVRIRETYNPGAISKVTAFLPNGQEVTIWEGTEPQTEAPVDTAFAPLSPVQANSVKVYLDTRRVPGWNEIDAIELIGRDGSRQWASSAQASSTYAEK